MWILPQQFDSKIGSKEPENRRTLSYATTSKVLVTHFIKNYLAFEDAVDVGEVEEREGSAGQGDADENPEGQLRDGAVHKGEGGCWVNGGADDIGAGAEEEEAEEEEDGEAGG